MTEVDKFKRRVIRAVARLLRKDQAPGEEMWKALQNESGCDCEILWHRMRALTLKKMRRLILAEDRLDSIAAVAKMTLTDWLLFDLVLVHEDIDVIGQDLKTEPSMLTDLFNVVKWFQIEGKQGEALATAWTVATINYNSLGRQCSPMMLQRRWYQLKKLTRTNFYKFWFEYRGMARFLSTAKKFQPTKLQTAIARRFPHLIIMPFLEWETMITEKWVILPDEFGAKMKTKNDEPTPATNEPDLVLVEPQIKTVDLGVESAPELKPAEENLTDLNSNINALNPFALAAAIKKEPENEPDMDFVDEFEAQVRDATQIPEDNNIVDNNNEETIEAVKSLSNVVEITDEDQDTNTMPKICKVEGNVGSVMTELTNHSGESRGKVINKIKNRQTFTAEVKIETRVESISDLIGPTSPKHHHSTKQDAKLMQIELDAEHTNLDANSMHVEFIQPTNSDEFDKDSSVGRSIRIKVMPINNIQESANSAIQKKTEKITEVSDTTNELDSNIDIVEQNVLEGNVSFDNLNLRVERVKNVKQELEEIIDDGDKDKVETNIKVEETLLEDVKNNIKDPLIHISTDLTFDDDGIKLVDNGLAFKEDDENTAEKKVNVKSESIISTSDEFENIEDPTKFDLKLLMHPCVYTIKLEDMPAFRNKNINEVKDKILLETAFHENKIYVENEQITVIKKEQNNEPVRSGNISDNESSCSEDSITEKNRVKLSNYMLQKPKSRSYNPIQLCKNPDFNTRLKRLTAGFLSSNRNRLLLKCLKPITIDLSKAFESRLINGTVYLKLDDGPRIKCEKPDVSEEPSMTAVLPSAMPAQSLIDNSSINLQELLPSPPKLKTKSYDLLSKRQKTINLPDINNKRRINQHLLAAEETPLISASKASALNSLEKHPKTNELPVVCSGINALVNNQKSYSEIFPYSVEPANTEEVSDLSTAPVEKKKYARVTYNLSWNAIKKPPGKPKGVDEFLLTLDTLSKMLLLFNEEESKPQVKSEKLMKIYLTKQKLELQKRMDQFEKRNEDSTNDPEVEDRADKKTVEPTESKKEKKKEETPQKVVTPKINIVTGKPYGSFCCWARMKIRADGKKALRPHRCPNICRCCCRDTLAKVFYCPPSIKVETKKVFASINTVVNHSQNLLAPIDKVIGSTTLRNDKISRSEASIQCDNMFPSSDFGEINLASVPAHTSISLKKPQSKVIKNHKAAIFFQRNSKTLRPITIRKDLLHPVYRSPILPVKDLRHINIGRSQKNVQIHHEPVNFNSKQKSKDIPSPVFLGENKILLTDIKFPSTDPAELALQSSKHSSVAMPLTPPTMPAPSAALPIALALPSGVQVILLPDGRLTYTINPGAKLTAKEIASLPIILDALRQQLNQTSATNSVLSPSSEEINLTDNRAAQVDASSDTIANADITSYFDSVGNIKLGPGVEAMIEQRNQKPKAVLSNFATDSTENSDENQLQNIQVKNQIDATTIKENFINADADNITLFTDVLKATSSSGVEVHTEKKNASSLKLSDQIPLFQNNTLSTGDETEHNLDTVSQVPIERSHEPINIILENMHENPNESTNNTAISNRKTLLSDLMEMSGISEEDIQTNVPAFIKNTSVQSDVVPAALVKDNSDVPKVNIPVIHVPRVTSGPVMPRLPELTPITSFSQLRYATEHNGRFFKLDLQLGTLAKIAVRMQKNKRILPPGPLHRLRKSVINLTEDPDLSPDKATKITNRIKTNKNENVSLDEEILPAHVILTGKDHKSVREESLPATVKQTHNNTRSDTVALLKQLEAIRVLKTNKDIHMPLKVTTNLGRGLPEQVSVHVKQKRKQEFDQSHVTDKCSELETEEIVNESSLYLAELDQYKWKEYEPVSDIGDHTSDDEPLAYKSKRRRVNETQKENSLSEISEEPAVTRQEEVTIFEKRIAQDECEMEEERLLCEEEIAGERFLGQDWQEEDISEETDIPEDVNVTKKEELTGVEGEPIEGDLNFQPASQAVKRIDEDGSDDYCILGF